MLRSRLIWCTFAGRGAMPCSSKRTYLSQEFKTTMEKRLEIPQIDRSTKKLFNQTDQLLPYEIDSFINRLPASEDRRGEIYEQLLKLRASEFTTSAPETLSHEVINYLLSISTTDDLLSILSNRLQYGIFIDSYSGCYLMDIFLEKGNYAGAAQVAVELLIQEDFEDELVQALTLKSSLQYVKSSLKSIESAAAEEKPPSSEEKADKPVKIRVKFLRNPPEKEMINSKELNLSLIGQTVAKFSSKCSKNDLKHNGILLDSVLSDRLEETMAELVKTNKNTSSSSSSSSYFKDVIDICLEILQKHSTKSTNEAIVNSVRESLEKLKGGGRDSGLSDGSYSEAIDAFIEEARSKNEAKLIAQQNEYYSNWLKRREEQFNEVVTNQKRILRQAEIEETISDIESEKQKLWFFENQDKLDLDIYRKQVRYPKRWFGKKKKPRAVDDNYVPPEIRTK